MQTRRFPCFYFEPDRVWGGVGLSGWCFNKRIISVRLLYRKLNHICLLALWEANLGSRLSTQYVTSFNECSKEVSTEQLELG